MKVSLRNFASAVIGVRVLLPAAFLAALLAPLVTNAVYVSGSGFGQALTYPYYTVLASEGNAFNTFISIVNGHANAKALRVRFREGRSGREVASFNLFLGGHGVWTGSVVPTSGGTRLLTIDPACVSPAFNPGDAGSPAFLAFSAAAFSGSNSDGLGTDLDRLREGYVEVLEMASFPQALPGCAQLRNDQTGTLQTPQGYLYGTLTLINVHSGLDFTANAEALANLATSAYYRPPADPYPDFDAAEIGNVASFLRNDKLYRISMPTGLAAVEAAMVRARIYNEVVLDTDTASATDWILTMPTRRFHSAARPSPWFASASVPIRMAGTYVARNGEQVEMVVDCGFFICPGGLRAVAIQAPWSATVVTFPTSAAANMDTPTALGARNAWNLGTNVRASGVLELRFVRISGSVPFMPSPYVELDAVTTRLGDGVVATERIRLSGLPVTGFMVRTFRNGTLTCAAGSCQGNYGGTAAHRMRRDIDPVPD